MHDLRPLNNCEVFNQMRIELTNYHLKTKALNRFCFYSGNEGFIKDLAKRVLNVLKEHRLVEQKTELKEREKVLAKTVANADPNKLRGPMMYMVLNSTVGSFKDEELGRANPQCVHLLKQLPELMPQMVTVCVALICGLEKQLFEFLSCGPHWLTSQYFDCFNDVLGHIVPDKREALPLVCGAVSSVTRAICNYAPAAGTMIDAIVWANANATLVENAMRLLQRHLLDTDDRLRTLRSSKQRNRYLGEAVCQLLEVMLEIMAALDQPLELPEYFLVYALRSPTPPAKQPVEEIKPKLRSYAGKLMDQLQTLLLQVSVETYMYWQEMSSGELLFHLQAHICNKCLRLADSLEKDQVLKTHALCSQLSNFSDGAQTFAKRLETLTLGELLSFLDGEMGRANDEQLLAGLDQLMQRSICFGNDECVESMSHHIRLMTLAHAQLILDHLAQAMEAKRLQKEELGEDEDGSENESENEDSDRNAPYGALLRDVLLPIYQTRLSPPQKVRLLQKRDQLRLLKQFNFERPNHNSRRIFFFNQLNCSIQRFPFKEFLDLCYEHPTQTWLAIAHLAMTHRRYAVLYWHVAARCARHAVHHVASTVGSLLLDDRLVAHFQPRNPNGDLLLRLYEQPVLMNGMRYRQVIRCRRHHFSCIIRPFRVCELVLNLNLCVLPYSARDLQLAQENYLSAGASGLAKFLPARNYVALERLLNTLLSLGAVEERIKYYSRKSARGQGARLRALLANAEALPPERIQLARRKLRMARAYMEIHSPLGLWRISYWPLISQLILTMDQLRSSLNTFDPARLSVLDLIVEYYVKNMTHSFIASPDLKSKVEQLINTRLEHKHLWKNGQLGLLLEDTYKLRETGECVLLLTKSSTVEAIKLLCGALRNGIDITVMRNLAKEVDLLGSSRAHNAYEFVFRCYMRAFRREVIAPARTSEYSTLIKHLLRAPNLSSPNNLLAALGNLRILLRPTGIVRKAHIMEHVSDFLALQEEN